MKFIGVALLFVSMNAKAVYINCSSANLTVGMDSLSKVEINFNGRKYIERATVSDRKVNVSFTDKDRGTKINVSFAEFLLNGPSGVAQVNINRKVSNCNVSNAGNITF
ncbi:MAG TPA: hypothetical protein VNJ01_15070 [Bacteriovoracaceae bacterium]|nr:hypothetical protein [Bacteriovoracaceae bacterium]